MNVIFDPERILTDTGYCHFFAWKEMSREQGIEYDEELDAQLQGTDAAGRLEVILTRAHRSYSQAERMVLLTRQSDLYDEILVREGRNVLLPGAMQLIQALKAQGHVLGAVMTGGLAGQVLSRLPIGCMFQVFACEGDVAEQLRFVVRRLKAAPENCLLVSAFPAAAGMARAMDMPVLLYPDGEERTVILQQILSAANETKEKNGG